MAARAVALLALLTAALAVSAVAEVYLEEKFDDTWESRWTISDWKKSSGEAGDWVHTAGKWYGDASDKGIQTTPDARFFAISSKLDKPFDNTDKDLVLQYQIKWEKKIDCGGGYVKLLSGDVDQKKFSGDTEYSIMFGPDVCGASTKRVHAIITYKGKNLLIKKNIECETDQLSHVYTFILSPNNTYRILIDNSEKGAGSLYDDWDFLEPKQIKDPSAKKPSDWVDDEYIADPEDKKPEGYDDIPAEIVDPEAKKPEDWDDEDDGEWEAPMTPNPEYKGEWKPKKIKNSEYKGKWSAPLIDNPKFSDDPAVYKLPPLTYVGLELWQVKSGSIFDNFLVTDDAEYAKTFAENTWGTLKDGEKTMFDDTEKEREAAEEEERKKSAPPEDDDDEPEDFPDEDDDEPPLAEGHDEL